MRPPDPWVTSKLQSRQYFIRCCRLALEQRAREVAFPCIRPSLFRVGKTWVGRCRVERSALPGPRGCASYRAPLGRLTVGSDGRWERVSAFSGTQDGAGHTRRHWCRLVRVLDNTGLRVTYREPSTCLRPHSGDHCFNADTLSVLRAPSGACRSSRSLRIRPIVGLGSVWRPSCWGPSPRMGPDSTSAALTRLTHTLNPTKLLHRLVTRPRRHMAD